MQLQVGISRLKFLQWRRFLMATVEVSTCIIHCCISLLSVEGWEECCLMELSVGCARLSEYLIETYLLQWYCLHSLGVLDIEDASSLEWWCIGHQRNCSVIRPQKCSVISQNHWFTLLSFMKSLIFRGRFRGRIKVRVTWNSWVNQWFLELTENWSDFTISL